jgi:hypothetical protein
MTLPWLNQVHAILSGQPWLLLPRISRFVTSPSRGYTNRPFRATDGRGTFTLQDPQPYRLLRFQDVNTVAVCSYRFNEAESLQGGASPLWPTGFSVYASPLLFTFATVSRPFATLSAKGATLDTGGWLTLMRDHLHPSPTGTFTRQEAPSFAWRTKDKL